MADAGETEMEVDDVESHSGIMIPLPEDPEPSSSRRALPPSNQSIRRITTNSVFLKLASSEEISRNVGLTAESSVSSKISSKSSSKSSSSSVREKSSLEVKESKDKDQGNPERDIPAVEYADLRKEFNKQLREMFASSKPHSKSKIIATSGTAIKKSYMYKVVEIALSAEMDKMFETNNYDGIRAGFFLIDAIVSGARKKFGKKELFSDRLSTLLKTLLDRLMKLSPAVISKGEKEKTAQKKQVTELRKTKREVLRIVHLWTGKKYFKDDAFLTETFETWSVHFPELKALDKLPSKKSESKPEKTKSEGETVKKTKPEVGKSKTKEKEAPRKPEVKLVTEASKTAVTSAPPVLPLVATGSVSLNGNCMDLESRVKAMAASGRLPAPGFNLKPPELPLYATVPLSKLLNAPAFLPPPAPPVPPPALIAAAVDPLSAFYKDIQGPANANRFAEPPRSAPMQRFVDPLDNLSRWHGYAPRNRPNFFTVVSNILSLHYLPKKENLPKKTDGSRKEETPSGQPWEHEIRMLCSSFGNIKSIAMAQNSAVVTMENRFGANKMKKYVTEDTPPPRRSANLEMPEVVELIRLIKTRKILLEWHPAGIIKHQYLKYWESTPQGVAYIPYDVCYEYMVGNGYDGANCFSLQKFGRIVKDLTSGKDTVIVADSLPPSFPECKEIYHQVLTQVFPEALQRSY